jgi:uncharacterized protein DUF4160
LSSAEDGLPTIHLEAGFEVRVFIKDHEPPHVHVVKDKATVVIELGNQDVRPSISRNYGMKAADVKKALRIVAEQQGVFLQKWRKYHGQK